MFMANARRMKRIRPTVRSIGLIGGARSGQLYTIMSRKFEVFYRFYDTS